MNVASVPALLKSANTEKSNKVYKVFLVCIMVEMSEKGCFFDAAGTPVSHNHKPTSVDTYGISCHFICGTQKGEKMASSYFYILTYLKYLYTLT